MIRAFHIAVLCTLCLFATGCNKPKEVPIWEQVKIGDLAPTGTDINSQPQQLNAIRFDVFIYEVPASNAEEMAKLWQALYIRPVRFYSASAFKANMFSVGYGDMRMSTTVRDALTSAGGIRAAKLTLLLAPQQTENITVTTLPRRQTLSYISKNRSREVVNVGPGVIALRIKAVKTPGVRDSCSFAAEPAFSLPIQQSIPELAQRVREQEVEFPEAGFAVRMSPKDLVVLGPTMFVNDDTMLPGLFFTNPKGGPFPDENPAKMPQHKTALRVFVIVCTGIN